MANFQRSTWATLLFIALLAPFAIVLAWSLLVPLPKGAATKPGAGGTTQQAARLFGPAIVAPPERAHVPMFAAGDSRTLWVAHPVTYVVGDHKSPAFELLQRASNSQVWTLTRDEKGSPYFRDYPEGLAAVGLAHATKTHATPYLFFAHGTVQVFSNGGGQLEENLPPDHTLLATAGSPTGVFALTRGVPPASTTRPGDVLDLTLKIGKLASPPTATSASRPATHPSGAAATQPAKPPALVNAYWFRDSQWTMLPPLGKPHQNTAASAPSTPALSALSCVDGRLVALWIDPASPKILRTRCLDYRKESPWTQEQDSQLPEAVPHNSRIFAIALDQTLYIFWSIEAPPGSGMLEIHGGRMLTNTAGAAEGVTLPPTNILPVFSLKKAGDGLNPATDVVMGAAENSIAVVVNRKDNTLASFLFNDRGELQAGPTEIHPKSPQADVEFAQSIAMLLLILMLMLSFWQWRQRPTVLKLPAGMTIARPGPRAAAFFIDLAIPYIAVCLIFGLWDNQGYIKLLTTAGAAIMNFPVLFASHQVMLWLALYLAHVTVGELFFRRSVGKAIMGLQVLMIDGKPPTLAAIVVRNLIRLPELLLGILVIYLFISPHRQRLGDLIGHTLVISHKSPEAPPDAESGPPEGRP